MAFSISFEEHSKMSKSQMIHQIQSSNLNNKTKWPNCKWNFSKYKFCFCCFPNINLSQIDSFFFAISKFYITYNKLTVLNLILIFIVILFFSNIIKLMYIMHFIHILSLILLLHFLLGSKYLSMMIIISILSIFINTWIIWLRFLNRIILILLQMWWINFLFLSVFNQSIFL